MTDTDKLRLALQRALIELEYAHEAMGNDRSFTRADVIGQVRGVLANTDAARVA